MSIAHASHDDVVMQIQTNTNFQAMGCDLWRNLGQRGAQHKPHVHIIAFCDRHIRALSRCRACYFTATHIIEKIEHVHLARGAILSPHHNHNISTVCHVCIPMKLQVLFSKGRVVWVPESGGMEWRASRHRIPREKSSGRRDGVKGRSNMQYSGGPFFRPHIHSAKRHNNRP